MNFCHLLLKWYLLIILVARKYSEYLKKKQHQTATNIYGMIFKQAISPTCSPKPVIWKHTKPTLSPVFWLWLLSTGQNRDNPVAASDSASSLGSLARRHYRQTHLWLPSFPAWGTVCTCTACVASLSKSSLPLSR